MEGESIWGRVSTSIANGELDYKAVAATAVAIAAAAAAVARRRSSCLGRSKRRHRQGQRSLLLLRM